MYANNLLQEMGDCQDGRALLWLCWLERCGARMLLEGNDLCIGECGLGTFLSQGN